MQRVRGADKKPYRKATRGSQRVLTPNFEFKNPYPWMSAPEAMVKLVLEGANVNFTWRYFTGDAPTLKYLMPDFHPEFTLPDYKTVIVVMGTFWGTLPGVLDRTALAQAALELDGWSMVILFEFAIRQDARKAVYEAMPILANPPFKGKEQPNPYLTPGLISSLRLRAKSRNFGRALFKKEHRDRTSTKETNRDRFNRRNKRRRTQFGRARLRSRSR